MNYEFVTILTDDTILKSNYFPVKSIKSFFNQNCDPSKDILLLPIHEFQIKKEILKRTAEIGMTLNKQLFNYIKFREDLIMDQFDLVFCDKIHEIGGKIIVYPEILIEVLPIGREENKGKHFLPDWRLYLLTRNTIALFLERKSLSYLIRDVIIQNFILYRDAIIYGNKRFKFMKAGILGILDGLQHNLGITENLQKLSNNRFDITDLI